MEAFLKEGVNLIFKEGDPLVEAFKQKDASNIGICIWEKNADDGGSCPQAISDLPNQLKFLNMEPSCGNGWVIAIGGTFVLLVFVMILFSFGGKR